MRKPSINANQGTPATAQSERLAAPPIPNVDQFSTKAVLGEWRRSDRYLQMLFTDSKGAPDPATVAQVQRSRLRALIERQILMCSYENPWGSGGGLFQIARKLPAEYNRIMSGELTRSIPDSMLRLSPLHGNLSSSLPSDVLMRARQKAYCSETVNPEQSGRLARAPLEEFIPASVSYRDANNNVLAHVCYLGSCEVPFGLPDANGFRQQYTTHIYRAHDVAGQDDWMLFGNDSFFQGDRSPYEYHKIPEGRESIRDQLVHDALFAAKATPYVAAALGINSPLFHLQDWQFAGVALTAKEACLGEVLSKAATVLTMHNVYDQTIDSHELSKITDRTRDDQWTTLTGSGARNTLLTRMIPLLDAPVSAVSSDLIHDVLGIPSCFEASPTLVDILRTFGAVGIFNGTYVAAPRSRIINTAISDLHAGQHEPILQIKAAQRCNMLSNLVNFLKQQRSKITDENGSPILGQLREENEVGGLVGLAPNVPVFFTMGRFDPNQKGQDLFLEAIHRLPADIDARFIVGAAGISPENFPEFYERAKHIVDSSNGRAIVVSTFFTGQLRESLQQGPTFLVMPSLYEPTGMVTEFNAQLTPVIAHATGGLRRLVTHYDFNSGSGSGFHFGVNGEYEPRFNPEWASIRGAGPKDRANVDLYNKLADALAQTLQGATEVFAEKPEHYARMLSNLPQQVTKFSWGPSVFEYLELFDRACTN